MAHESKIAWSRREVLGRCMAYGSLTALGAATGSVNAAPAGPAADGPAGSEKAGPANLIAQALQQTLAQFAPVRALVLDQRVEPACVFKVKAGDERR